VDSSLLSLQDRVALVTGAGRGIGRAIALTLAGAGADLVLTARTQSQIEETAAQVRLLDRRAVVVPADVSVSEHVARVFDQALSAFGRIDILVNNAGGSTLMPLLGMSDEHWDENIAINLRSVFLCSRAAALQMMNQGKGVIVNVASMAGASAAPTLAAYGAAKAGVVQLTQTMAIEWAPLGIRVNAVAPGFTQTDTVEGLLWPTPERREQVISRIPLGRIGQPEDIAAAVLFFASDASSWITAQTLPVDGGTRW